MNPGIERPSTFQPGSRFNLRLHRQGQPEFREIEQFGAAKPPRRDTENRVGQGINSDLLPDDSRISVKSALPEGVAQDSVWAGIDETVVLGMKESPQRRT